MANLPWERSATRNFLEIIPWPEELSDGEVQEEGFGKLQTYAWRSFKAIQVFFPLQLTGSSHLLNETPRANPA